MVTSFVTTTEASALLGVSVRRVEQMGHDGDLVRVGRGLLDRVSIERHRLVTRGHSRRAWSEHTAWAAIALLAGYQVDWLDSAVLSRLRTTIRNTEDAADFASRCRDRAEIHVYRGHESVVHRVAVRGGGVGSNLRLLGLTDSLGNDTIDHYIGSQNLKDATRDFMLQDDIRGNITFREVRDVDRLGGWETIDRLTATETVAALDAMGSLEARIRGVGEAALHQALRDFR